MRATNVDLGGGRGEVGGQEQAIRTLAGARQVESLADAKIILGGGREVRLTDLGRVVDDASEQRSFARLNGQPVVTFSVFRSKGTSELSVADVVDKTLEELETAYPDVQLTKIDDAVAYTRGNYIAAMETLIEGAVLAVLVVLLFLRNMRATLIAAIALPLSAIPTFWAMSASAFRSTSSACSASRWSPAFSSTTPSSRSRTSCATCAWANRPIAPPSRRPTRSASPSSPSR